MATDKRKVMVGSVLLVVSSILILGAGPINIGIPAVAAGGVAALGLAAGALLVGTSEDGRPV
jgi:hypothetical protein